MLTRSLLRSARGPRSFVPPHAHFIAGAHDNTGGLIDNRPFQFSSPDGISWTRFDPAPMFISDSYWLRDPSIVRYKGTWYCLLTDGDYDEYGSVDGPYQIARSDDLSAWERLLNVPAPAGAFAGCFFIDPSGLLHLIGSYYWTSLYEQHPLSDDLATWSEPIEIGHSAWQWTPNDPFIIHRNGKYFLFHGKGNGAGIACLQSDSPFTGYTQVTRGSSYGEAVGWGAGLSQYEAPCLIEMPNGNARIYYTHNNDFDAWDIRWSETADLDLATATWSEPQVLSDFAGYNHAMPFMYFVSS